MTAQPELQRNLRLTTLRKSAVRGAAIGLVLVLLFIVSIGVDEGINYLLWPFLPMFTVSTGGTVGGVLYALLHSLHPRANWKKVLVTGASVLLYITLLHLSLVAALNITGHWD